MTPACARAPATVVHLVVGPVEHGVVRHGRRIAEACGHKLIAVPTAELPLGVLRALARADVVHLSFTDRLFGPDAEAAADTFAALADAIHDGGPSISVTLHDVPDTGRSDDGWAARRTAAYRRVIEAADGVVVNSRVDLAAVQDLAGASDRVRSLRLVDHAVDPADPCPRPDAPVSRDVTVLGFVFPDRGYEQVLDALPAGSGLVALGRASDGHEDLPGALAARAAALGRSWRLTGFVADADLAAELAGAAVPVAPNRRVTSSGSVLTWLAHGRRPIVPATAYTAELAARMPGAITLYDPADASGARSLGRAIARALADPGSTWLDADVVVGPSFAEAGDAYRAHFEICAPERALPLNGRAVLPGNRWDLLARAARSSPHVTVVVPYHRAQADLDRVLTGLRLQTIAERIDVVVADDGSPHPPDVGAAGGLPVQVVRQARDGFGASRARRLGAAHARGEILAFLDGDTVPAPQYLERLTRLPAADPDVLTVGRRLHAQLDGWAPARLASWLTESGESPSLLSDPEWLRTAYLRSDDLLEADARSYRFVISAVLCLSRALYERAGGFDERFTSYGGEDWELANRAWHAGGLFAHVPDAVAWHNGADWAGRGDPDARQAKNAETLALARLLPDPDARGAGGWSRYPHTVLLLAEDDPVRALATVRTALAGGTDCATWLVGPGAARTAAALDDPRVQHGLPPADVVARAAAVVAVPRGCDLRGLEPLVRLGVRRGVVSTPAFDVVATRALRRCGLPVEAALDPAALAPTRLLFGAHQRAEPSGFGDLDLAGVLASLGARSD